MSPEKRTSFGVATLACAALLLESTLTRLLAVAQYYHFAFLVVSLALLGFGAGGAVLASSARLARAPAARVVAGAGAGFALSTALAYAVVNLLPFDSYRIAWEPRQLPFFAIYYLALTLPFLCAGIGICAALAAGGARSHLLYAANLFGSAAGVLLAPVLMVLAGIPGGVLGSALVALLPLVFSPLLRGEGLEVRRSPLLRGEGLGVKFPRLILAFGLAAIALLTWLNFSARAPLGMVISPYKGLSQALRYPGAQVIFRRWSAISRVDVVAGAGTRRLPGLSYTAPALPLEQLGLSSDAESLQPITLSTPEGFAAAAYLPETVAFRLKPGARVLVLEPGGGLGVLQALAGGAREVVAVAGDALGREAVRRTAGIFDPFAGPQVTFVSRSPRAHLHRDAARYDVIFLPLTDSYRPVASGAYSLGETYGLTVEAMDDVLGRLAPGGVLVVTRWLQTPPSEELRLVATLIESLRRRGAERPGDALVAFRGIQTLTALVRPDGWPPEALDQVRASAGALRYDLVWTPDIAPEEANRYNVMPSPAHYQAVRDLLAAPDPRAFYAAYRYAVAPTTDDRPFFFHFFRWGQAPQVLATLGRTWQPFGGSGYLVLFMLLALVLLLSLALIVAPLALRRGLSGVAVSRPMRLRALAYFGLIGLAFLFVEVPLIQRYILLFNQPAYAFTVVVLALLVFSGIGSALSTRPWMPQRAGPLLAGLLALLTAILGDALVHAALGWPAGWRVAAAVAALAPLGLMMGLPFPFGLAWLQEAAPSLVPWAWAVNGCASVIASVLAAIVALTWGLTAVLGLGAAAYIGAWLALSGLSRSTARRAPRPGSSPQARRPA
jgi:phage shock protein PspC (stress-responsive transcriptional regulator)